MTSKTVQSLYAVEVEIAEHVSNAEQELIWERFTRELRRFYKLGSDTKLVTLFKTKKEAIECWKRVKPLKGEQWLFGYDTKPITILNVRKYILVSVYPNQSKNGDCIS